MVNKFYITAGLPPTDNGNESGVNKFYITAGLVPDDTAAAGLDIPIAMYHYQHH